MAVVMVCLDLVVVFLALNVHKVKLIDEPTAF